MFVPNANQRFTKNHSPSPPQSRYVVISITSKARTF